MSGGLIRNAREALVVFLKSIPEGSFYNVVSFGSKFKFMNEQSIQVNNETIQESIDEISQFEGDMGGTELYDPLKQLLDQS